MPKSFLVFIFSILAVSCSAAEKDNGVNSSCSDLSVEQFYSSYEVFDVAKYGGGITTEETAKQRVGTSAKVAKDQFQVRDFVISNPSYKLKCYGLPKEGEVPVNRWSNFYGFGMDRSSIEVLEIFDKEDAPDEPSIKFEILNGQLWEMSDGWLYKMKPST